MRTGAIFARGSCRALKWMALLGVVFVLGAVEATAQLTATADDVEVDVEEAVSEGDNGSIVVTVTADIAGDTATTTDVTVTIGSVAKDTTADPPVTAEPNDVVLNTGTATITFPSNNPTADTDEAVEVVRSVTIPFSAGLDPDEAEDEIAYITVALSGGGISLSAADLGGNHRVDIDDEQTQIIELTENDEGEATESADAIMLTLKPKFVPVDDTITVVLTNDGGMPAPRSGDFRLSPTSQAFSSTNTGPVTVTLTGPENDGDRETTTVTVGLTPDDPSVMVDAPPVQIADAHILPSVMVEVTDTDGETVTRLMEKDGGAEYTLTVTTVDKEDPTEPMGSAVEALKVTLSLDPSSMADASDYTLVPSEVTLPTGTTSDTLTLTVLANVDTGGADRMERLAFQAVVSGDSAYGPADPAIPRVVDLDIVDATNLHVTPLTDAAIEAAYRKARTAAAGADGKWTTRDAPLMIPLSELFTLPAQGQAEAMSSDEDIVEADADADASADGGGMVTVTPMGGPGMAEVTVTVSTGVSAFTGTQLSATSAQVVFEAMVDGIPVTAKTQAEIDAAYMAARNAAAGADGYWTTGDGPATIPLSALFNDLPSDATASVMSSMTDYVLASTTGSDIVLNPQGVGTSTVTVTVAGADKPASFMATVVAPRMDTRGSITAFSIAGTEEKTVDGVKRMHLTEGGITTATVTVTWTNQQLTALWAGHTAANPPPPARINLYDTAFVADAAVGRWLSLAETSERDGTGSQGGNDVVWGSRDVEVKIPAKPKTTASPAGTDTGTGTTSVSLPNDDDAEPEAFRVSWWPAQSQGVKYVGALQNDLLTATTHVIEDDEPQGIKLTKAMKDPIYEGGGTVKFSAVADPRREDLPLEVRYTLSDSSGVSVSSRTYTLDNSTGTIPVGPAGKDEVVLNVARNDGDRMDDMLQMHAEVVAYALDTGAYGDVGSKMVDFTVIDVHKLPPVTVMPETATLMEGKQIELTVTVDRNPRETRAVDPETLPYTTEELSIAVMASGATGEYSLSSAAITVPEYKHKAGTTNWLQPVKVTVEALMDEDVEPDSMLMLDFVVNGTVAANGPSDSDVDGQASVTIQDATATLVSVRDNAYDVIQGELGTPPTLTTGMSGELTGANLFDYDPSAVSVAYATSVDGAAVTTSASGGTVTIMAVSAGEAKVTITATATPNGSSLVVNQTKSNVAQLTFPVMVEDPPLTFTVMGPDDMNLIEGGMGGMVKVMTNRAVSENTEVMLMRDGSSSAGEDDYELDPPLVTIMAGQNEGHTMVMALADDMMENAGNMPEMLTLFLVVDGMQMSDQSVSFYIWDAAVPALPVIAQLLLAALLGLGGYRRYLRRR